MTAEQVFSLLTKSVGIAAISGILTQLAKPIILKRVKEQNKDIVLNVVTFLIALLAAYIIAIWSGWNWTNQAIAELLILTVFGWGLSVGGYEWVSNIIIRVTPNIKDDEDE